MSYNTKIRKTYSHFTILSFVHVQHTLAGRYHITERIFWLVFFVLAILGSHHLIVDAIQEYEINSVSMVVESLRPSDQTDFVSVALCEMGHTKQSYSDLDDIMKELSALPNNTGN